jgi:hypothetical protein
MGVGRGLKRLVEVTGKIGGDLPMGVGRGLERLADGGQVAVPWLVPR